MQRRLEGARGAQGDHKVDVTKWYSQEAWLRSFGRLSGEAVGAGRILFNIGCKIPKNAVFPPWVVDVKSAVRSIDIAYHMNHRKNGQVMFDPGTETMLEGIGHYGYDWVPAESKIISVCRNPYPCAFDRGIVHGICYQYDRSVRVVHKDAQPCRNRGADSCTFEVLGVK